MHAWLRYRLNRRTTLFEGGKASALGYVFALHVTHVTLHAPASNPISLQVRAVRPAFRPPSYGGMLIRTIGFDIGGHDARTWQSSCDRQRRRSPCLIVVAVAGSVQLCLPRSRGSNIDRTCDDVRTVRS